MPLVERYQKFTPALWTIFLSVSTHVFPSPLSSLRGASSEGDYSCPRNHSDTSYQTDAFLKPVHETPAHFLKTQAHLHWSEWCPMKTFVCLFVCLYGVPECELKTKFW